MPILPDVANALVEPAKARDYLLNRKHREGAGKARVFIGFGFARERWIEVVAALLAHAQRFDASQVAGRFRLRWTVEGPLDTSSGRRPWIGTVWEIKEGPPRLVTAYPFKAPDDD